METKVCTKCKVEKETTDFHVASVVKNTFRSSCKNCIKEITKNYRLNNKEKIYEKIKNYRLNNKEKIKECNKDYSKKYYQNNKEKESEKAREYYINNKEKIKEYIKIYEQNNKDRIRLNKSQYYKDNKDRIRKRNSDYTKKRKQYDPLFSLGIRVSKLINIHIKKNGYTKKSRTHEILGCSYEEFKSYIESKFQPWMNWDNCGNPKDGIYELNKTWDIDHIIPLSFAITEEEIIKLNHYTNLQPLCSYTNRNIKRDRLDY